MTGDRWTFLVVRGEDTPVRQYTVSARVLRAAVGAGSVVALVLLGLGLTAASDATAASTTNCSFSWSSMGERWMRSPAQRAT